MALKITIEKVDDSQIGPASHQVTTIATVPDKLPVVIVVKEDNTAGITVKALKGVLNMAIKGKMLTAITTPTGNLANVINLAHAEHVDPIV